MQPNKSKKNLSDVSKYCQNKDILSKMFLELLNGMKLSYINSILRSCKSRGVDSVKIFQVLFVFRFLDFENINQIFRSKSDKIVDFEKDTIYDFMKNPKIDWRKILHLFRNLVFKIIKEKSVSIENENNSPTCFILDDTQLDKSGKNIEFIGKVYDHCSGLYSLGIKVLTLGFWDGKSFSPVDFSVHNEPGKTGKRGLKVDDLKGQFSKQREPNSSGFKRASEIGKDKIQSSIDLVAMAVKKGMRAKYVLADSWFVCEKFITQILALGVGLNVIGLMKSNRTITHNAKTCKASTVPQVFRKRIQCSKKFKCHYIRLQVEYKGLKMNMFWVRMKGQSTWKVLVSTDLTLPFVKVMEYYQIRWSIEVFFRDCKQNLGLNKCQSTDFDAHIAHITIVYMNYMVLSLKKRFEDYETLGEMFRHTKQCLLEITMVEKIWQIIIEIYLTLFAELGADMDAFILKIIELKGEFQNMVKNIIFAESQQLQDVA